MKQTSLRIVHTEASCGWGGQEIRILTEAQGMINRGHRVEIWAVPGSNILAQAAQRKIPHRALPIGRKRFEGIMAMRRALASNHPNVINTHSSTDTWLVALARLTLRHPPPVVRTRHISAPIPRNWPTRWLYTRAASHVVTTGEYLREVLIRDNRHAANRITSVPTGVDGARFHPGDKTEARRRLGLDPSARYLGIVATLRSWKGHLYLIEAFDRLARDDGDLQLIIVGDGPMREVIEQRIASLGLTDRVVLAGRQEAVETWLQAMDVFCLPSYANEGVPQAVIQAMLTGLPVVTTPVGSTAEAVTDGVTGLLVPAKDAPALAEAIKRLLTDATLARRLGDAARSAAAARFSLDTMLDGMETVFHRVVEHGSGSRGSRMPFDMTNLCAEAAREWETFRQRVAGVPYERKGVLFSEMYFLYLCARHAAPRRILESGRARGQSTLLLSLLFPELPVISFEHDPASPDVAVAGERLKNRRNVDLRFGDATRILASEARAGDIVLIDGPKGFRGLRLALSLLATGRVSMVFLHDAGKGSVERAFLEARVPGVLYSDELEFARRAHLLDMDCRDDLPADRRFEGERAPAAAYGYGMACLVADPAVPYRRLLWRAMVDGFLCRHAKSFSLLR